MTPSSVDTVERAVGSSGSNVPDLDAAGDIHVLHVDDEPAFASMASEFLQREEARLDVETATDVSEALSHLRSNAVDCVVSDYDMPGRNGIEFLEVVREEYPELPFILYTGKGSEEVASRAISAGVTEYLQKGSDTSQYTVLANRITNAVEQYRARRAFEASQKRLSLFIEQSPLGVIEWDENFDIRRMNEKAEAILGYSESDLTGNTWETIVPESHLGDVETVVSNLLQNKGGYHSFNDNIRKDGERVTCEWHNRVVTDRDGAVVAIFSQFHDVTERVERERKLDRQRSLLEAQRESVLDGQLVVDEHGEIISHNERFLEMWGVPEEVVESGQDAAALDFVTDQLADPDSFMEEVERLYENAGETARDEIELTDGRVFDRYTTPLVGDDGTYFGRLWTFRNITDRKEREKKLQRQNERLGEFVNIVSHDLRDPLSVAHGQLELAQAADESGDLDAVADAHERIDEIIEELLELARTGTDAPDLDLVNFAQVVEESRRYHESAESTLTNEAEFELLADRSQLQLMLRNLIGNSVEHGGDDVTITIGDLSDGWYIRDDGPGIPEDRRDQVFDSGFTTKDDGTGFGLDIVNRVVEAHGWSIRVTQAETGGARFDITGVEMAE